MQYNVTRSVPKYLKDQVEKYNKRVVYAAPINSEMSHIEELKKETLEEDIKIYNTYCYEFGCGRVLTLTEKLCGNKCINHCRKERRVF